MYAVCSYNKRPMTQSARSYHLKTGESAWGRDVYHLQNNLGDPTLCGRQTCGWSNIGAVAGINEHCCVRCAAKFISPNGSGPA